MPYPTMTLWYALSYNDAVVRLILQWSCGTPYLTIELWYALSYNDAVVRLILR